MSSRRIIEVTVNNVQIPNLNAMNWEIFNEV
jgi:hypothetical protein